MDLTIDAFISFLGQQSDVLVQSKMADADKTDLIPADVSHPDPQVWIVRPQFALTPGEYALMLGTQNISIFPFSVGP